ncbi:MAG TPA: protein kinase, partial [Thermoanaerobaculia bacterium]|nr:protein kinase [Thermoanaerobaculia bacterium]
LAAGTRLGSYEILSPIGAGGMGEVYKAKDTKLDRFVAVKVLPESLARDPDALARFEREAHAVAALNHPNILSIHDFGSHDGVAYAVTELLEGETLRSRLEGGAALPPRRAVEIATAIARGLAAAHEKGIIHRDLKPDNVFLTSDGRVKILDFGLAKKISRDESATEAPTAAPGTEPGTVMGTVGYMSPEQVRGRDIDHRTDIFSFGAILYEMLSGRRAFRGDSHVETMNAILKEEPPELVESGRNVSPALDRIVRHCLEKNPESRFHSAGDVAFDLESLSVVSAGPMSGPARGVRGGAARRWKLPAALAATAALFLGAGLWLGARRAGTAGSARFTAVTHDRGIIHEARFSPDGRTIAYGAAWNGAAYHVYLARTDTPESTPLAVPEATVLSLSSKGELAIALGYRQTGWMGLGQLARVPLLGGTPRPIVDDVIAADWAPDGEGIAVARRVGSRYRIEYPIGKVLYETGGWISHLRFSRDGTRIAFANHPVLQDDRGTIDLVDLRGAHRVLTEEWSGVQGACWSSKGDEILFAADSGVGGRRLMAVRPGGKSRPVFGIPGNVFLMDVAPDGRVLLTREERSIQTIAYLPGAEKGRDLSWLGYSFGQDFSPDDRLLLTTYVGEGSGNNYTTYLRPTDGSPAARVGEGGGLALSPDGKWVADVVYTPSPRVVLYPMGAGEARSIAVDVPVETGNWISNESLVLVAASGASRRAFRLDVGAGKLVPLTPEGVDAFDPYVPVTPDGRAVVLRGPDRRPALYPISGGAPTPVAGWRDGDLPVRFADERTLFVVGGDLPIRIEQLDVSTGARRPWRQFDVSDAAGLQNAYGPVVMSRDGRAIACNYTRRLSSLFLGEGIR